jgi:hypothetical protein
VNVKYDIREPVRFIHTIRSDDDGGDIEVDPIPGYNVTVVININTLRHKVKLFFGDNGEFGTSGETRHGVSRPSLHDPDWLYSPYMFITRGEKLTSEEQIRTVIKRAKEKVQDHIDYIDDAGRDILDL